MRLLRYYVGALRGDHACAIRRSACDGDDRRQQPVGGEALDLSRGRRRLQLRGPRFTDADLSAAIQAALTGLIQSAA